MRRASVLLLGAVLAAGGCGPGPDGAGGAEGAPRDGRAADGIADTVARAGEPADRAAGTDDPRERTGLYVYLADAAVFTECGTDEALPVAGEGASAALERAYLLERAGPGEPALVRVVGRAASRPAMEGPDRTHLVVDSVLSVSSSATCPGQAVPGVLEGTAWQLVGLPDRDPSFAAVGAWMRLDETGRVGGFTGCRDLSGRFEWRGTLLRFSALDVVVGMCDAADVHAAFLEALGRTGSYRLTGGELHLMGEEGVVARFDPPR